MKNSSLVNDIRSFISEELTLEQLHQKIADLIIKIAQNKPFNAQAFEEYFGENATDNYLNPSQLQTLKADEPETFDDSVDKLVKLTTTFFFHAALKYSCHSGCVLFTKYLIDVQKVSADHEVDVESLGQYFNIKSKTMKKRPLCLAVKGGNLKMVQYIYESTNSLIELPKKENFSATPLMIAAQNGFTDIMRYLLEHAANPNAVVGASEKTPLQVALGAKQKEAARILINEGAIVSNSTIINALTLGYEFSFIKYLLQNNVQKESGYASFLVAAVEGGDVDTLKGLENLPGILSFEEVKFYQEEGSIEQVLLGAALSSGSMDMLNYIQSKGISARDLVHKECTELEAFLISGKKYSDMEDIHKRYNTFLYKAYAGDAKHNRVLLLKYLIEDLGLNPSDKLLKRTLKSSSSLKMVAYLQSKMTEFATDKNTLMQIAFELDQLDLMRLFELYNYRLIQSGNVFNDSWSRYHEIIASLIKEKLGPDISSWLLRSQFRDKPEALTGALFYFSTPDFEEHTENFMFLLNRALSQKEIRSVDVQNCEGTTLASWAIKWRSTYHILRLLMQRGANPDTPNNKGETLLNSILDFSFLLGKIGWVLDYATTGENSLKYAHARTWGNPEKEINALMEIRAKNTVKVSGQSMFREPSSSDKMDAQKTCNP